MKVKTPGSQVDSWSFQSHKGRNEKEGEEGWETYTKTDNERRYQLEKDMAQHTGRLDKGEREQSEVTREVRAGRGGGEKKGREAMTEGCWGEDGGSWGEGRKENDKRCASGVERDTGVEEAFRGGPERLEKIPSAWGKEKEEDWWKSEQWEECQNQSVYREERRPVRAPKKEVAFRGVRWRGEGEVGRMLLLSNAGESRAMVCHSSTFSSRIGNWPGW